MGVGGSLFFLAGGLRALLKGVGITLSPLQAGIARSEARRRGLDDRCVFLTGDFTDFSAPQSFQLAFAIEAFVHFGAPDAFFAAAARSLALGGRLIVVDDFLAREKLAPRERWLVRAFQEGWILPALSSVRTAAASAAGAGFHLVEDTDLSPHLSLPSWHPGFGRWGVRLMRALPLPWSYWQSTSGSLALSMCQREGLTGYHYLVFEKSSDRGEAN